MSPQGIISLVFEVMKEAAGIATSVWTASKEELEALEARLQATLATMRSERARVESEIAQRTKELQDIIDAEKAKP